MIRCSRPRWVLGKREYMKGENVGNKILWNFKEECFSEAANCR